MPSVSPKWYDLGVRSRDDPALRIIAGFMVP